jgi:glutaconyl-CoA/methylmalonyl-CoA decarboxylase subunit gamma
MKKLRIIIEGRAYDVTVEVLDEGPPAPLRPIAPSPVGSASVGAAATAAPPAAAAPSQPGVVHSPLAGKVVSVQAAVGQRVNEGDQLLVLEAMKMNTYIYAPHAGEVAEVLVQAGSMVEEGQVLVRLSA